MLGKERTSSIPVCLVMNVSGYGIDLHVGNRVIDMEDFLTTAVKALEHLVASGAIDKFPNIIALQSEKCDPLYQARMQGLDQPATVPPTPTMAEGIAIGVPMRGKEILGMMRKHDMKVVTCPEDKILEARGAIARRGIYCEHTTAANYAAWLHYCELYGPTPDTLITMCGAGIKSDH